MICRLPVTLASGAAVGVDDESGVDRDVGHDVREEPLAVVELAHRVAAERHVVHAGPAGLGGLLGQVLLRGEADGGGLHAHRHVLGHDGDRGALALQVERDGEDPRVVVAHLEPARQHRHVRVVELDAERAAAADGDGEVEALVLHAQLVEAAQGLPGEVADLGIVALALELADDDDRQHDGVLREPEHRGRIRQQHRGVQDVGAEELIGRIRGAVLDTAVDAALRPGLRIHALGNCHDDSPHSGAEPPAHVLEPVSSVRVVHRAVSLRRLRDVEPYFCGRLDQALYLMTRT